MSSRPAMWVALAIVVVASLWLAQQPAGETDIVDIAPRRTAGSPHKTPAAPATSTARNPGPPEQRLAPWPQPEATALAAWSPPPAPIKASAAASEPPARPRTPAFPYQWIGRLEDGDVAQALLSGTQRSFGVQAGDVIDSRWRVDKVIGNGLLVTWLQTGDTVTVTAR